MLAFLKRPLILNELAAFYLFVPIRVTTKVTTSTLIYHNREHYVCQYRYASFIVVV